MVPRCASPMARGLRLGVVADIEAQVMLTPRANVRALQNSRLAVRTYSRCAKRAWTNDAHQDPAAVPSFFSFSSSQPNSTWPRMREPAATVMEPALTSPTMTPPSSTSTRLADSILPCSSRRPRRRGQHLAGQVGTRLDVEVAVDADIALEPSRHAHVARSLDLAFDGQVRGDDGLSSLATRGGRGPARRRGQGCIARDSVARRRTLGDRSRCLRSYARGDGRQGFFTARVGAGPDVGFSFQSAIADSPAIEDQKRTR